MTINILIIVLCVAIDQLTKDLAATHLISVTTYPLIKNVLHLTYVENRGAAFGMLADHRWVFMLLSTVGIAAVFVYMVWARRKNCDSWLTRIAVCLIIGGGIGNMIDRIVKGYVVDFIDCRFLDFYVFNGADSFVCVGCGLFLLAVILDEIKERKKQKSKKITGETTESDAETEVSTDTTTQNGGEQE